MNSWWDLIAHLICCPSTVCVYVCLGGWVGVRDSCWGEGFSWDCHLLLWPTFVLRDTGGIYLHVERKHCVEMYAHVLRLCSCDRSLGILRVFYFKDNMGLCVRCHFAVILVWCDPWLVYKCSSFRLIWLKVLRHLLVCLMENKRQSSEVALMEAPRSSKHTRASLLMVMFHL